VRRLAALVLLAGVACGGNDPGPSGPIALDPTTVAPKPTVRRTATPKPTATLKPTPTPTTPPPPTGTIVTAGGAFLAIAPSEPPRQVSGSADCGTIFPEISAPRCNAIALHGGNLLWVTGRVDGSPVVRLLTQEQGGYVTRYAGRDDAGTWGPVSVFGAPLTGRGTDGLVVAVRLHDRSLTYDVLTWFKGGPLVLRAHRGPLADGRLAARDGHLEDYALVPDGRYAQRILAWDGRYFRASAPHGFTEAEVPPR